MSRVLEIAIKNRSTNNLLENVQPDQLFKKQLPDNVMVRDIDKLPIDADESKNWKVVSDDDKTFLAKTFSFAHAKHLMYFVNESIRKSEELNHHPKMIIEKNTVSVESYTHDIGEVTSLDKDLTAYMDEVYLDIVYIAGF